MLKDSGSSRRSLADSGGGGLGPRQAASSHSVHGCLLEHVIHKTLVVSVGLRGSAVDNMSEHVPALICKTNCNLKMPN